jgi:hypothetical protein
MLNEHDRVVLTEARPGEGLEPGDIGAIVHVYPNAAAYEVEFITLTGQTVAVLTLEPHEIRPVGQSEIPHARALAMH